MKILLWLLPPAVAGCCLWSCKKNAPYPEIPEIHLQKVEILSEPDALGGKIKTARVTFLFADGDGDLGDMGGNVSKIHYRWMQKMPGGQYEEYLFPSDMPTELLIPYDEVMNREEAYNQLLKGTMDATLSVPSGSSAAGVDTVKIELFIVDRAAHPSNVEITPDFSLQTDSLVIELGNRQIWE
ncbi:MAG: hypothetical protein LBR08_03745 [Bacteroidales bacterium]|nr:hypothetical protein [Bacteroidales bacterium]